MPAYTVRAINIASFDLGEADKVLTVFSAEKGLLKVVAKGARKPRAKMSGRSDILCANQLLLSSGRTFEIVSQAQTLETFFGLRQDLVRLSYGLYYAELTRAFAHGVENESEQFFDYLLSSLRLQSMNQVHPVWLCLEFEMGLLNLLGYHPELSYCVNCRQVLCEYNLAKFNLELGGIVCVLCSEKESRIKVKERDSQGHGEFSKGVHITPLVWKILVLGAQRKVSSELLDAGKISQPVLSSYAKAETNMMRAWCAAQKLLKQYAEHRVGKRFRSLDLLGQVDMTL